jgi:hypothetical protein
MAPILEAMPPHITLVKVAGMFNATVQVLLSIATWTFGAEMEQSIACHKIQGPSRRALLLPATETPVGLAASSLVPTTAAQSTPEASLPVGSGTGENSTARIVAAASAFLDTRNDAERKTVLFAWTDTAQKQRWSNFPDGAFEPTVLM